MEGLEIVYSLLREYENGGCEMVRGMWYVGVGQGEGDFFV